ncbi:MAG: transcription antitermination factor NusB [Candidatus Thermochlorobacter aerophilum]|jgi:N utilization substance protein B|uniref:Transcription antitermination protein NusB n=1 Tax=Candidatus Thermochlorobacter aerophilus TaxID=1868324 RepID=A0A395M3X3_9BACT|nr:MAG: transcription antitermination factor NusB [Candidatus Thermochlorobacter aerophilum]
MVNRRQVREVVMQVLYARDIRKDSLEKVAEGLIPEEILAQEKSRAFAQKLLTDVVTHQKMIDEYIAKHADNWELDRMAVIDRNLMRMAIAEFLFMEDIPPKVTINEAIEISKKYSTEKSGKFINGILDATLNELRQSGKLQKSGRGLVDLPAKQPRNPTPAPPAEKPPSSSAAPKSSPKPSTTKPSPNSSSKKSASASQKSKPK